MALIVTNSGENLFNGYVFKSTSISENFVLCLYTNNYDPVATSTTANFTEASFTDYTSKTLTRGSFNDPSTNGSGKSEISYASQTWTVGTGSSATIYGYYVKGSVTGTTYLAEKFSTARALAAGDSLVLTPKFTLFSEN